MPTCFTLIRHGQTAWNVEGRWQGHANVGLSDEGLAQAEQLGAFLRNTDATVIYASDLSRARQTAEAIVLHTGLPLTLDPRLREIDMGEWQGMTGSEVELWDKERLAQVRTGGLHIRRPGGESVQDVADRALALFNEIIQTRADDHVLLVSHGGTLRHLLRVLGHPLEPHAFIENTSRTGLHFDLASGRWQLDYFNALDHLRPSDGLAAKREEA